MFKKNNRQRSGGWRWWTRGGFLYVSVGTDINWFRVEVGPLEVRMVRSYQWGGKP